MTVAQLIAQLTKVSQDAEVIVYSGMDEGADYASKVILGTDERPYVKGDWPDYGEETTGNKVIIL